MSREADPRERESVLRDLGSAYEELRRLAVERIEALGEGERIPRLIECLGDPDWRVRKAAVARMVAQPDSSAAARGLIGALADGDNPGRRNAAVEALVALGAGVVPELLEACGDGDADVRKFAVDALAGIGDERAVPRLIDCLMEADPNVRAAAADALGAIGGAVAADALVRVATESEDDALVRFSALHALDTLEVPLRADQLAGVIGDPMLGPAALGLVGRSEGDPGAAAALLKGLGAGSRAARESAIRGALRWVSLCEGGELRDFLAGVREVAGSHPVLLESAITRLEDAELGTRLAMVQFLGLCGDARAVLPLLRACRDEALAQVALATLHELPCARALEEVWQDLPTDDRRHACLALGGNGEEAAAARLVAALDDRDPEVRAAAAQGLGELGAESGLEPLVRQLGRIDPDADLDESDEREAVVEALSGLVAPAADGTPHPWCAQAVELLGAVWQGADDGVRLSVAQVLGRIARPEDHERVALLLMDPSPGVRRAAVEALARLEPAIAAEPLHLALADESAEVRLAAAKALGAAFTCLDDLRTLCGDEDPRVRAASVAAIGRGAARSEDPELREACLELLGRAGSDQVPVALAVVEALAGLGAAGVAPLASLLERPEPEVVREAVRCFGRSAEADDLERLFHLVSHPEWSVRAETIEVLAERGARRAVPAILRRLETEQDDFVRKAILAALARLEN